jgi:sirohydrochlorin cobaltochelatase
MKHGDAALLLAGHGSTVNGDSSAPTYQHAESIRERGLFHEVHECFWKEEPNFRHVLRSLEAKKVYIVPNFISSGYFTEQVIPREFGLSGAMTEIDGREIYYCEPVGLHPSMTDVLLQRAAEVVASSGVPLHAPQESTCLMVIGHGTGLNENSTKIIYDQVELIRARHVYAECQATFMEQAPFIKDWQTLTQQPEVIAVPFFIADGLHSFEDIPVLLGMTENVKKQVFANPHEINGRRLWYGSAIGTEPSMAEVILAQVEKFDDSFRATSAVL